MAGSNPFRRKQLAVLGLDSSTYIGSTDNLAAVPTRRQSVNTSASLRSHAVNLATSSPNGEEDDGAGFDPFMEIRRETESLLSGRSRDKARPPDDTNNPFYEDSEAYDSFDEDIGALPEGSLRRRRTVPSGRARTALNTDHDHDHDGDDDDDGTWRRRRTSVAVGGRPGHRTTVRDVRNVAPKAQRMLGISGRTGSINENELRRQHSLSPRAENVAPKAQRTLGISSNPFSRKGSFGVDDRPCVADEAGSGRPRAPMDVEEFKRLILTGDRDGHGHRSGSLRAGRADTSSSTDVSSMLSRSSLHDSHSQTSRSSREIAPDDESKPSWNSPAGSHQRPPIAIHPAFRHQRPGTDVSSIDHAAHLTEPFTPISPASDLNKPLPLPPLISSPVVYELADTSPPPVELDASPLPVELPALDFVPHEPSSDPPRPKTAHPPPVTRRRSQRATRAAAPSLEVRASAVGQRSDSSPEDGEDEDEDETPRASKVPDRAGPPTPPPPRRNRPSAIFENPNLFELPSSEQQSPPRPAAQPPSRSNSSAKPSIPPARNSDPARRRSQALAIASFPQPPPSKATSPLAPPPPPPPRRGSSGNTSPSGDGRPGSGAASSRKQSVDSNHVPASSDAAAPQIGALTMSGPLVLTTGPEPEGPIAGAPPVPEADADRAAAAGKRRVALQDPLSPSSATDDGRPFSWQSTPLQHRPGPGPSAEGRPRADAPSPIDQAVNRALSKEGMEKALEGERIADLVRSAGGRLSGQPRDLLHDLGELQKEVDALRGLYAQGASADMEVRDAGV